MTRPSDASVVPIRLSLDGRSGVTLWATPWEEDGEEWQAFLGSGRKVLIFYHPEDLSEYLQSGAENDLTDHPSWSMLTTLPPDQLEPEDGYEFDLDGVYDLASGDPDPFSVSELSDLVDIVQRLAECCDDGTLLRLVEETPEFAGLLADEVSYTGAEGDEQWTELGEALDRSWELVIDRLGGLLEWRGEPPPAEETAADEDDEDEDAETGAADEDEDDEDDEDEDDEDEDEDAEGGELATADEDATTDTGAATGARSRAGGPAAVDLAPTLAGGLTGATVADRGAGEPAGDTDTAADTETADAESAAAAADAETADAEATDSEADDAAEGEPADEGTWAEAGILPVSITLPGGTGYSLRTYVDDDPQFLGADLRVYLFRGVDALVEYCQGEDEHDLSDLETWPLINEAEAEALPVEPGDEDTYDLTAPSPEAIELCRDLAAYCQLAGVEAALSGRKVEGGVPFDVWVAAVAEIESCVRWQD